ncbi:MAG TPA: sigma-54 dependent transcriptional regulator [Myxococcota bacterium]|jgi:DNA-binding NtrC family response regulator|nr:sigma-54 dependent transcriptional regulator [Myxococcota bacterium]
MLAADRASILVVDDDTRVGNVVRRFLERSGHEAEYANDPEEALRLLRERRFDLVLTDLMMPRIDGLELLRRAKLLRPSCEVIVMTAFATVGTAREALKRGAIDYLTKPFSPDGDLLPLIESVLRSGPAEEGDPQASSPAALASAEGIEGDLVARSAVMRQLVARARKLARAGAAVLLRGESGSGKEVLAALIHRLSPRAEAPLVKVNCAALPESLFESELFGYARGAFTGADSPREGLFQAADGGTLFLDEVGEMPLAVQAKLLRVLQDGEFHRIGDPRRPVRVDVRVIAATNLDLESAVAAGAFRKDLYYRLNVVPLVVPPLRERPEDLAPLLEKLLARAGAGAEVHFSREALDALQSYAWPGNVRELANAVQHALVLADGTELALAHLPLALQDHWRNAAGSRVGGVIDAVTLEEIERRCIEQALTKTGFHRTRAAELLGITRRTLGYRIQKYGLESLLEGAPRAGRRGLVRVEGPSAQPAERAGTGRPSASAR